MNQCQLCGGQLGVLGVLGRLLWLACRNCGMHFSRDYQADEEEND